MVSVRIFEDTMDGLDEEVVERPDFVFAILDSRTRITISRGKSEGSLGNLRGKWFEYAAIANFLSELKQYTPIETPSGIISRGKIVRGFK